MSQQGLALVAREGNRHRPQPQSRSPVMARASVGATRAGVPALQRVRAANPTLARCTGACQCGGSCQTRVHDDELSRQLQRAVAGRSAGVAVAAVSRGAARGPILARAITSPRFLNEPLLEDCFDDKARMKVGARDTADHQPVSKVQQALLERGFGSLLGTSGPRGDGVDGVYGQKTAEAVKAFKAAESLGSTQFGDVGPGTMHRLNDLFPASGPPGPTPPTPPPAPPTPPVPPTPPAPPPTPPTPPAPVPPTPKPLTPDDQKQKDAFDDRRKQLRAAALRLSEMQNVVLQAALTQPGEGPAPSVSAKFPREVCAVRFFLHTSPSAPDYFDTLGKARDLMLRDVSSRQPMTFRSKTPGFCDPVGNFAATCAPGTCAPVGTELCDPTWYDSSRSCRSDVLIHETYHFLGLPKDGDNFPNETKPADAFQNADTMTQFGNALMGLAIDNCVPTQRKSTAFPAAMTACLAAPPAP